MPILEDDDWILAVSARARLLVRPDTREWGLKCANVLVFAAFEERAMFDGAIGSLQSILKNHSWISELAGILPLSALIDFIDVPLKLHIFELVGGVPLWSWPITPAGSRLLLSNKATQESLCLDRFGYSTSLVALDGRYGEQYFVTSPETLRLAVESQHVVTVENEHENMKDGNLRAQSLEVVFLHRTEEEGRGKGSEIRSSSLRFQHWSLHSAWFLAVSMAGWFALFGFIATTVIFRYYLATAFLALMPITGIFVHNIYGIRPRRLLVTDSSTYNRMIVVSEHMNSADWTAFYGESTILNSLLNRPLKPIGSKENSPAMLKLQMAVLRFLILGQWGMAIGASATKDWNSFFICFWIAVCIVTHAYVITPKSQAKDWLKTCASINIHRYRTKVSSRRALLNTLISLNPDTFAESKDAQGDLKEDTTRLYDQALRWIDPILKISGNRTIWERATLDALNEVAGRTLKDLASDEFRRNKPSPLSAKWNGDYKDKDCYWRKFVPEGIYVASKIKLQAQLPGRKVFPNYA
ncbi:hypothetical protein CC80DRAFT_498644 [Byssothecium circinans]|uniref:Uncharacterized protein n=1 Tax=Byssothecium circinans TaxID=147558 RepID=A0A6A5UQV7_9PLEO|nr:hypothetical protein CC80DRAFT_498644 [Byssothecium circinans]